MGLETGNYISDLVQTNPLSTDLKSQGDDHLRLIKKTLKQTFPVITGEVTSNHVELSHVKGVSSPIQIQIDSKGAITGQNWTGDHNFPTQPPGDRTTKVATTVFAMTMDSPEFSGIPKSPTASVGTNTTQISTTEFVTTAVANEAARATAADAVIAANVGAMLGINFGAFSMVAGELIVTHLTTTTPSISTGDLILTYETL
jgi:hypothetical protein